MTAPNYIRLDKVKFKYMEDDTYRFSSAELDIFQGCVVEHDIVVAHLLLLNMDGELQGRLSSISLEQLSLKNLLYDPVFSPNCTWI